MDWVILLAVIVLFFMSMEPDAKTRNAERVAEKARRARAEQAQARSQAVPKPTPAPKPTPYSRSHISARLRSDVLRRDKSTCQHCGAQAPNVTVHVDHKVPASKGGTTTLSNLQVLCAECNLGKGNRFTG